MYQCRGVECPTKEVLRLNFQTNVCKKRNSCGAMRKIFCSMRKKHLFIKRNHFISMISSQKENNRQLDC